MNPLQALNAQGTYNPFTTDGSPLNMLTTLSADHYFNANNNLSFSVYATFPSEPGLVGFVGVRMMEVMVTTGAIRRAKL